MVTSPTRARARAINSVVTAAVTALCAMTTLSACSGDSDSDPEKRASPFECLHKRRSTTLTP